MSTSEEAVPSSSAPGDGLLELVIRGSNKPNPENFSVKVRKDATVADVKVNIQREYEGHPAPETVTASSAPLPLSSSMVLLASTRGTCQLFKLFNNWLVFFSQLVYAGRVWKDGTQRLTDLLPKVDPRGFFSRLWLPPIQSSFCCHIARLVAMLFFKDKDTAEGWGSSKRWGSAAPAPHAKLPTLSCLSWQDLDLTGPPIIHVVVRQPEAAGPLPQRPAFTFSTPPPARPPPTPPAPIAPERPGERQTRQFARIKPRLRSNARASACARGSLARL
jgi:hypothetical protein